MTTDLKQNGIRKAAILVSALSPAAARRLLAQMLPPQAEEVRRVQSELGPVDTSEQRSVIEEFFHLSPEPGVEVDESLARKIADGNDGFEKDLPGRTPLAPREGVRTPLAPREGVRHAERGEPKTPPFRFLQQAEDEKLAKLLGSERPQTVALVLSHLPPEQAGAVLVRFPPAAQVEIIRRLVDLEETHPEILREVGQALEVRLSEQVHMQRRRVAGLAAVEGILAAAGSQASTQIFENLAALDHSLADKLGPERLEFSELVYQDDQTLATLLTAAGRELWMLALVGAPPALVQRVFERLPAAEAEAFRYHLDHLGPTRLSDVEESRRRIEDLTRRLVVQRRITLAQRGQPAYQRTQKSGVRS
jgi:flagellar motor switch protein FliG